MTSLRPTFPLLIPVLLALLVIIDLHEVSGESWWAGASCSSNTANFRRYRPSTPFGVITRVIPQRRWPRGADERIISPTSSMNPLLLDLRGGDSRYSATNDCYEYITVGIINFLHESVAGKQVPLIDEDGDESSASSTSTSTPTSYASAEELIMRFASTTCDIHCTLLGLPSASRYALIGEFQCKARTNQALSSYETISTLSDTSILLINAKYMKSNDDDLLEGIGRLIRGIERRVGGSCSRPRMVVYVRQEDGFSEEPRVLAEKALLLALSRKIQENGIINTLEDLERAVDIIVLPYSTDESIAASIISILDTDVENDLPLSMIQTLAHQVCASLLGTASTYDGHELISFQSVGIASVEDTSVYLSEDIDEEEGVVLSAVAQPEAARDDDNDSSHESLGNSRSPDAEGGEGNAASPQLQLKAGYDGDGNSDLFNESIQEEGAEDDQQQILLELNVITHRILSDCQDKMSVLEAKQDEVLLDPDNSMPILEFGRNAQSILEGAMDAFQDAIDAIAVGGGDVNGELEVHIEGKHPWMCMFSLVASSQQCFFISSRRRSPQ